MLHNHDVFAYPPIRMRLDEAARYVGDKESTFLARVADKSYPPGMRQGGCRYWLTDDLKAMVQRQFNVTGAAVANDEEDPFAARMTKTS